jgi:hypothetical protein
MTTPREGAGCGPIRPAGDARRRVGAGRSPRWGRERELAGCRATSSSAALKQRPDHLTVLVPGDLRRGHRGRRRLEASGRCRPNERADQVGARNPVRQPRPALPVGERSEAAGLEVVGGRLQQRGDRSGLLRYRGAPTKRSASQGSGDSGARVRWAWSGPGAVSPGPAVSSRHAAGWCGRLRGRGRPEGRAAQGGCQGMRQMLTCPVGLAGGACGGIRWRRGWRRSPIAGWGRGVFGCSSVPSVDTPSFRAERNRTPAEQGRERRFAARADRRPQPTTRR